jgi:hypothetical protein
MPNRRTCKGIGRVLSCGACPADLSFDQTKPCGAGRPAPVTPEYRATFEATLTDQAKRGEGIKLAKAQPPPDLPYFQRK